MNTDPPKVLTSEAMKRLFEQMSNLQPIDLSLLVVVRNERLKAQRSKLKDISVQIEDRRVKADEAATNLMINRPGFKPKQRIEDMLLDKGGRHED